MQWILQIPALLFSVIIHEYAHGYMAMKRGDDTAYIMGRLTLNPISHIDPVGSLLLPILAIISGVPVIGWAKPVPVNPYRMYDMERSMIYVALAGPFSNILLATLSAFLLTIINISGLSSFAFFLPFIMILKYLVIINLVLGYFNLFPLYPLDGGQIVMNILPYNLREKYMRIAPYSMYIIIFLVVSGIIKYWIIFPLNYTLYFYKFLGLSF